MARILGPDGRPVDTGLLTRPIAGASTQAARPVLSGHPADGLTPTRLAQLLRSAEDGDAIAYLELAEQMEERDLHYLAVLGTRKRQVAQLPVTVEAASDDRRDVMAADMVREWIARDSLEFELFDVLDAIGKGFSFTEIVWAMDGRRWFPDRLLWRDPRWFEFSRLDGETPLLRGGIEGAGGRAGLQSAPLPAYKFLQHRHPAKSGLAIRSGFARPVAWAWLFKAYGLKDWVAFAEVYGLPFRVGRYDAGASEEDIRTLMRAVANISSDAAAVMPKSMEVQFVDGKSTGGAELWERLCQYLDRQISKAILGQTATTDADTGGLGSGKEHGEVRADIERADARLVAATIKRDLIAPMIAFNFGPDTPLPNIRIGRDAEYDVAEMADALAKLVPVGLKVGMSTVRDRLGFPDPEADEELLSAASPPPPGNPPAERREELSGGQIPGSAAPHFSWLLRPSHFDFMRGGNPANPRGLLLAAAARLAEARADEIDAAVDAILSGDSRALLAPLVEPVIAALMAGESFEEAAAILDGVLAEMDETALAASLERACLTARIAGAAGR
jgi:phage gp29-like protein